MILFDNAMRTFGMIEPEYTWKRSVDMNPAFKPKNTEAFKLSEVTDPTILDRFHTTELGYVTLIEPIRNSSVYHGVMEVKCDGVTAEAWVVERQIDLQQHDKNGKKVL